MLCLHYSTVLIARSRRSQVELLTESERSTTVMAVRDSELARLPHGLFNVIKHRHPVVMARLIKLLGNRCVATQASRRHGQAPTLGS